MLAIILQDYARTLLFAHLVCAVCALAATLHLALRLWRHDPDEATCRLHAAIVASSYSLSYALGALIYPTFRVTIRARIFDHVAPWATGLFEAKEHLATLGLLCALAVLIIVRSGPIQSKTSEADAADDASGAGTRAVVDARFLVWGLLALLLATLLFNAFSGWTLSNLRSI